MFVIGGTETEKETEIQLKWMEWKPPRIQAAVISSQQHSRRS